MGDLEFGKLDRVLVIEQAELKCFAIFMTQYTVYFM